MAAWPLPVGETGRQTSNPRRQIEKAFNTSPRNPQPRQALAYVLALVAVLGHRRNRQRASATISESW